MIFFAWGARGPRFKSRRPDQRIHRLTLLRPLASVARGSKLGPTPNSLVDGSRGTDGRLRSCFLHIARRRRFKFLYTCRTTPRLPQTHISRQNSRRGTHGGRYFVSVFTSREDEEISFAIYAQSLHASTPPERGSDGGHICVIVRVARRREIVWGRSHQSHASRCCQ